jgi:hypothetical protein
VGPRLEGLEPRTAPTVNIQFVIYGGDPSGFFKSHPQALADLQRAGQILGSQLNNKLAAIQPGPGQSWTAGFADPRNIGAPQATLKNLAVPANTLIVYVAAGNYAKTTLMVGTEGRTVVGSVTGPPAWQSVVAARGQAGPLAGDGGTLWGGSLTVNTNVSWSFSGTPGPGQYDFVTLSLHELGHVLGFGGKSLPAWTRT